MHHVSIDQPSFSYDTDDPAGFRAGVLRVGPLVGSVRTGISVYEIPPGEQICPYHYEVGEEEWLLVLESTVELRTPAGTRTLHPMEIAFFPPGPSGAHAVRNTGEGAARVLMLSNVDQIGASYYPDSDKINVYTGDEQTSVIVPRAAVVDYYDGEVDTSTQEPRST